jgi:uncharacterized protein YPO0396
MASKIENYNRSKKDARYRTLIGKVQEAEPDATRDTVVKNQQFAQRVYKRTHKSFKITSVRCRCKRDICTKIMVLQSTSFSV